MIEGMNWNLGLNAKGQPIPNPAKYPKPDGALVLPSSNGATSRVSASFDPETGLFYVGVSKSSASSIRPTPTSSRRLRRHR